MVDYVAGVELTELADRYQISRHTVISHARRRGVRMRYPKLDLKDIEIATELYRSGRSLADVGREFAADSETIRRTLLKSGVALRDHQGRDRR